MVKTGASAGWSLMLALILVSSAEAVQSGRALDTHPTAAVELKARDQRTASAALALRPFAPLDRSLFVPEIYPEIMRAEPAIGRVWSDDDGRRALELYMEADNAGRSKGKRRAVGQCGVARTMLDFYEDPAVRRMVPDPRLRAGFSALVGTAGQPILYFVLTAKTPNGLWPLIKEIRFADFGDRNPGLVEINNTTHEFTVKFNTRYQFENPFLWTSWLAHELAFHLDPMQGGFEEMAAKAVEVTVYLQQLSRHPELASVGTELVQRMNSNALTRLNSGTGDRLGLYESIGNVPIYVGSPLTHIRSWNDLMKQSANQVDTPAQPLTLTVLSMLATEGATLPPNSFSRNMLNWIDLYVTLSPETLVAAAHALRLAVPNPEP